MTEPEASSPPPPDEPDLEGIQIDIQEDGTVRLHAACRPGEDPSLCRERIQGLVDALGLPLDGLVTDIDPPSGG